LVELNFPCIPLACSSIPRLTRSEAIIVPIDAPVTCSELPAVVHVSWPQVQAQ
jgi:hypothetical protein